MKLRPTRNRVVIKQDKIVNKSPGGILLPAEALKDATTGVVIAAGKDDLGEQLKVDDYILFGKYAGTKVNIQNEEFVIMEYKDIIAVLEK